MKTVYKTSSQSIIPRYEENGALQLIAITGITFIMFHTTRIVFLIVGYEKGEVFQMMFPNIGLSTIEIFKQKPWTILSYGWTDQGFWGWFTNMIWAYCFASVLQKLAGYKQVIPLFFYALFFGGIFYFLSQMIGGVNFIPSKDEYFLGAHAGVMALAFAAFSISPKHTIHISEKFSIPFLLVFILYILLNIVVNFQSGKNVLMLCLGGALTGVGFAKLLQAGFRPGEWVYDIFAWLQKLATPDEEKIAKKKATRKTELLRTMYEPKTGITQVRIDEILDKIIEHGYLSLSREEKDILNRASIENE